MRSMKLWCAASSTGEEPYTHSMVLQEALGAAFDLKILSTDISTRVLAACKTGVYSDERVGAIPSALRRNGSSSGTRMPGRFPKGCAADVLRSSSSRRCPIQ